MLKFTARSECYIFIFITAFRTWSEDISTFNIPKFSNFDTFSTLFFSENYRAFNSLAVQRTVLPAHQSLNFAVPVQTKPKVAGSLAPWNTNTFRTVSLISLSLFISYSISCDPSLKDRDICTSTSHSSTHITLLLAAVVQLY